MILSITHSFAGRGLIDFAVRMDLPVRCRAHARPVDKAHVVMTPALSHPQRIPAARPTPRVIPGGRAVAFINTCTSETLVALLRQLKRAYWPFRWVRALPKAPACSVAPAPAVDVQLCRMSFTPSTQDTSLDRAKDGPCGSGGGFLAAALSGLGTDDMDAATTVRPCT